LARVNAVRFSPDLDGTYLLTASNDHKIRVCYSASPAEEVHLLSGHGGAVLDATFSPDGRFIASASADYTARIWSMETGLTVKSFKGHSDEVSLARFSVDANPAFNGAYLITGGNDGAAKVWDIEQGTEIASQNFSRGHILAASLVTSEGRPLYALVACEEEAVMMWNFQQNTVSEHMRYANRRFRASAVGLTKVLVSTSTQELRWWDIASPQLPNGGYTLLDRNVDIYSLALSPDERMCASGHRGFVSFYRLTTNTRAAEYPGHRTPVYATTFHPRLPYAASGDDDGTVILWGLPQ
jgi:WD40 repeat protein